MKWEIAKTDIGGATAYLVRTGEDYSSLNSSKISAYTLVMVETLENLPQSVTLDRMVLLPAWLDERLDEVGYASSTQAEQAGVIPNGKVPKDERASV